MGFEQRRRRNPGFRLRRRPAPISADRFATRSRRSLAAMGRACRMRQTRAFTACLALAADKHSLAQPFERCDRAHGRAGRTAPRHAYGRSHSCRGDYSGFSGDGPGRPNPAWRHRNGHTSSSGNPISRSFCNAWANGTGNWKPFGHDSSYRRRDWHADGHTRWDGNSDSGQQYADADCWP